MLRKINYLGCWGSPRKINYLAASGSQGKIHPWRKMVAKKSNILGGIRSPRNVIYLAVSSRQGYNFLGGCGFSWARRRFCRSSVLLGGQTAKKIIRLVNRVSLALYPWRNLLGGRPPRIISLAVFVFSLAVFDRQGNSVLV